MDLNNLTIKKAHEDLKAGNYSVKELVDAYLKNIEDKNKELNIFLHLFTDIDQRVEIAQEMFTNGTATELTGIPMGLKANIMKKGQVTNCSSKILENYKATYDATVVERLEEKGVIFLGSTNMDEFAMGSSTENSAFGLTKNPVDLERVPGGSSGGSAAAVAADMALATLGTDTGGSIRQPAAFCSVTGYKPTYGSVPRYGAMAMGSSLDQIGPLTKNTQDSEIIWEAMKGKDGYDMTAFEEKDFSVKDKYKIAIPSDFLNDIDSDVKEGFDSYVASLKEAGHEVEEVKIETLGLSLPVYYIIMPAEVSSNLARLDGIRYGTKKEGENLLEEYVKTRSDGFGAEVKRRLILGAYVLSSGYADEYYDKALAIREKIKNDLSNIFSEYDFILTPTTPTLPFKAGEKEDPIAMYLADIFTVTANIAGVPSISVPVGDGEEIRPSVQFMAEKGDDRILFDIAKKMESK